MVSEVNGKKISSLADQYPHRMQEFLVMSRLSVAAMCEHFTKAADMDHALGYNNAVAGWLRGACNPSNAANQNAAAWLQANAPKRPADATNAPAPAPTPADTLLIICPTAAHAEKVKRLCQVLGCEAVDF